MIPGLEAALATLARNGRTIGYGTLARDLGLSGPGSIARLTGALESLMEADAALGQPFRAALFCHRLSAEGLPARGFFQKAQDLGHHIANPADFVAEHRKRLITG
jgi:hypothetical protein